MISKSNKPTIMITLCAICTALTIVLSQTSVPIPGSVPVTLQTFAVALTGFLLGFKLGSISIIAYVFMGAIGLPVFSGFKGGFGAIAGYTGGFIWGFILMVAICGLGILASQKIENTLIKKAVILAFSIVGLLVCHVCGAFQYAQVANIEFTQSLLVVSIPYLLKDIISVVLAYGISETIAFSLKKSKVIG